MPTPRNKNGVHRILGMINYVEKFLPNLSEATSPLRELLPKYVQWHWEERHEKCLQNIKQMLISKRCLQFYDVTKPVTLQVDA